MSNKETVKEIYEAFGQGNVPAILEKLAADVDWEQWRDNFAQNAGVPYLLYIKGQSGVASFFGEVAKLGVKSYQVLSIMEGENQIAVEFEIETERFSEEEIHLWTFNSEGKVTRFRHYLDTAKHIAAQNKIKA